MCGGTYKQEFDLGSSAPPGMTTIATPDYSVLTTGIQQTVLELASDVTEGEYEVEFKATWTISGDTDSPG